MKRRLFIGSLIALSVTSPIAGAQAKSLRRIGVILPAVASNEEYQNWYNAFLESLGELGWKVDEDLSVDTYWATSDAGEIRRQAARLVSSSPEVILAAGTSTVGPVLDLTREVPVVFPNAVDPVAAGFVQSLSRPGTNATGFLLYDYGLCGKWLELLEQVSPGLKRVAVFRDPSTPSGTGQLAFIEAAAQRLRLEIVPISMRNVGEIERGLEDFVRKPNGGVILTGSSKAISQHDQIIALAARYKLPAVYYERFFAAAGGLISYGPDRREQYRLAAGYVSRILRGEKPSELPVQAPSKYQLVINLRAAKALGLAISQDLAARADEIIE